MGSCWTRCCGDDAVGPGENYPRYRPLVSPGRSPQNESRNPSLRRTLVHDRVEHVSDIAGAPVDKKWYHGAITDDQASERLIGAHPENGSYLVYDDPKHAGQYILVVYKKQEVHRWGIKRRRDGMYILGDDCPGAIAHETVRLLIKYHRGVNGKPIKLAGGGVVRLTKSYVYIDDK